MSQDIKRCKTCIHYEQVVAYIKWSGDNEVTKITDTGICHKGVIVFSNNIPQRISEGMGCVMHEEDKK